MVSEFVGLDADQTEQAEPIAAALQADPAIDGFMGTGPVIAMSGLNAATDAGRELVGIAGFDITPEIIEAIRPVTIAFTIDQQQYLQGYLPILLLYLYVTNLNVAGGGLPILTGPGFVRPENADEVAGARRGGHPLIRDLDRSRRGSGHTARDQWVHGGRPCKPAPDPLVDPDPSMESPAGTDTGR